MRKTSALPALIFVVIVGIGNAFAYFEYANAAYRESESIAAAAFVIAVVASYAIKIADQWDRTVVLRLGRFHSLGLFFIIPIIETVLGRRMLRAPRRHAEQLPHGARGAAIASADSGRQHSSDSYRRDHPGRSGVRL
jgi:hypothetical protein